MSKGMLGNLSLSDIQGPRNDLETKLAGPKGQMWLRRFKRFLRAENPFGVPRTFEVSTYGRSGEQLITDLEEQGDHVDNIAKQLLRSKNFVVADGATYKLALIMGEDLDDDCTIFNIRAKAVKCGYVKPPIELAPYIREMFSDEDLKQAGIWALYIMHEPVLLCGQLNLLGLHRLFDARLLKAFKGDVTSRMNSDNGYLFLIPSS